MKPSLHSYISAEIDRYIRDSGMEEPLNEEKCNELAEQIIKIIRDYHLVEDKPKASVGRYYDDIFGGG